MLLRPSVRPSVALLLATFLISMPAAAAAKAGALPDAKAPVATLHLKVDVGAVTETRPRPLVAMYAGYVLLQGYDAYSTLKGLGQGPTEANPMMGAVASHPAVLLAVKGGVAFAGIFAAERLWRGHHRGAAIALIAVLSGLQAIVDAHNTSVFRAQR